MAWLTCSRLLIKYVMVEDSIAYASLGLPFIKSSGILSTGEHFQSVLEKAQKSGVL
jgi:hypothetical protein